MRFFLNAKNPNWCRLKRETSLMKMAFSHLLRKKKSLQREKFHLRNTIISLQCRL
jgi:hypothetical protein